MRISRFLAERLGALAGRARAQLVPVLAGEAEALHDYRVALRRLRSVLKPLSGQVYDSFYVKQIRRELGAIAAATNELRDQEALRESLTPFLKERIWKNPPPQSYAPAQSRLLADSGASAPSADANDGYAGATARLLEEDSGEAAFSAGEGFANQDQETALEPASASSAVASEFVSDSLTAPRILPSVPGLAAFLEREARREQELRRALLADIAWRREACELPLRQVEALCILPVRPKRDVAVERFALDLAEPLRDIVSKKLVRLKADPRLDAPWLHDLRLDCKRLRYVIDFYQDALPPILLESGKLARKLQNRLGTLNDYANIEAHLERLDDLDPEFRAALLERMQGERERVRDKLRQTIQQAPI